VQRRGILFGGNTVLKTKPSTLQVDRLLFILRWLPLLSALAYDLLRRQGARNLNMSQPLDENLLIAVVVGGVYNIVAILALSFGRARANLILGPATLLGDLTMAVFLFWASGGEPAIMVVAGLFPVLVASLRFGWPLGIAAAITLSLADAQVFPSTRIGQPSSPGLPVIGAVCLLATGIITGLLHDRLLALWGRTTWAEQEARGLRAARERARAIYEMASILNATLDYNKVLEAALDVGVLGLREMEPDARLRGCVLLFRDNALHVASSRGLTRKDKNIIIEGQRGVVGLALRQAEPIFASDPRRDPELRYFVAFQDCRSILCIPLRAGFDNYGVLLFASEQPNAFDGEQVGLLSAIGTQATIALQNAVLYGNLLEEKERIVEVEEDARKKLARELHDGPTQRVAAIAMRINLTRRLIEREPDQAGEELWKVEELARKTTREIRHMLFILRPLVLQSQGVVAALEQLTEKMRETYDLNVILQVKKGCQSMLDGHAQGVVFYIVEEAINNVRKHAHAAHAWVRLYPRDPYFVLEIEDDGVGFDLEAVGASYAQRGSQSLGMINMRERAELVEGTLHIESTPSKGTIVRVLIPLDSSHIVPPESTGRDEDYSS
jgi:signal transduction histidine kinase